MQGERLELTKKELIDLARQHSIKGYRTMSKPELEAALDAAETEKATETAPWVQKPSSAVIATKSKAIKLAEESVPASDAVAETWGKESAKAAEPAEDEQAVAAAALSESVKLEAPELPASDENMTKAESPELEEDKPEAPPLKQTWTNHQLLIDDNLSELPHQYQDDRAVLLVRDPLWLHAYWDLSPESIALAKKRGGQSLALRVHDVTHILFDGSNSHHRYDIDMPFEHQRIWYLNVPSDDRTYLFEIGYKRANGYFMPLAISNPATTPSAKASELVRDRFATLPAPTIQKAPSLGASEQQDSVSQLGAEEAPASFALAEGSLESMTPAPEQPGVGITEDMYALSLRGKPYWSANIPKFGNLLQYPAPSSFAASSWQGEKQQQQPAPKAAGAPRKDFWLVANCELIVYGATESDAHLTVCGQVVDLRSDGTFTMRFELPDGLHPIPIHAVNADRDDERAITITVKRDTAVGLTD